MQLASYIFKITIIAWLISGLGYMVFPPFYEVGAAKFYVPMLGSLDIAIAYLLFRKQAWLKTWARHISFGVLVVAIPFFGDSSSFQGGFAIPMLIVESATITAALGLLALSFTLSFRSAKEDV